MAEGGGARGTGVIGQRPGMVREGDGGQNLPTRWRFEPVERVEAGTYRIQRTMRPRQAAGPTQTTLEIGTNGFAQRRGRRHD